MDMLHDNGVLAARIRIDVKLEENGDVFGHRPQAPYEPR